MALDTLSLPVLEPLTPGRLLDMTVLALSCLYAGRSNATDALQNVTKHNGWLSLQRGVAYANMTVIGRSVAMLMEIV